MARLVPIGTRKVVERLRAYPPGKLIEIENEGEYHYLIRTGRFKDLDKDLRIIRADRMLPRLQKGSTVTVLREMGLGDVLMVLIVIRALKEKHPHLNFRLATGREYLPLLQGLPFLEGIDSLIDLKGKIMNCVELRNLPERSSLKEHLERIDIFAQSCGIKIKDYSIPMIPPSAEERARAREMIGDGKVIALAVRGSTHVRTWPLSSVQSFALAAAQRGWWVAVIDGARFEMPEHHRIRNLTGMISLLEIRAVIAESEFCISPDSGLQHLAEALGTKCLAIYSTIPPKLRIAHYRNVKALWRENLPCVPCFDRGCAPAPCMQIPHELLLRGIENWDHLSMSTNADADISLLKTPRLIPIQSEEEIMRDWLDQ